jgi:hypothetical protein
MIKQDGVQENTAPGMQSGNLIKKLVCHAIEPQNIFYFIMPGLKRSIHCHEILAG